jgi:hypothetical protein
MNPRPFILLLLSIIFLSCSGAQQLPPPLPPITMQPMGSGWDPILDTLQARTIQWFLQTTDSVTGLALDRYPTPSPASIASVGFALTTYPIAAERGILTREQAARRVYNTLKYFYALPQGNQAQNVAGYRGLFYHFLRTTDGCREWNCELSTVDTGWLIAGALFAQSYFDQNTEQEQRIRALADSLYRRVDWTWTSEGRPGISFGWAPDRGFDKESWYGYNEAMLLYPLAFGSPTHPAPTKGWDHWTKSYVWGAYGGLEMVNFGPLFGHQYSHCWVDFRGIKDAYMSKKGTDYFENSRRATYTHQAYARQNPFKYRGYSDSIWGMTACDGPKDTTFVVDGQKRLFHWYSARGSAIDWVLDDGTLAPTAAASSIPFAPEICIPAVKAMIAQYGDSLFRPYGFADAFNPTYITSTTPNGWIDKDYLGIDQGPIVLMIENYRNGLVWKVMAKNPYVVEGLRKAGFSGGWLD